MLEMEVDQPDVASNEQPDSPVEDREVKERELQKTDDANITDVSIADVKQNEDISNLDGKEQNEVRDDIDMEFFAKKRRVNMTCSVFENTELLRKAMSKLSKEDDEHGIFGRYVASVMRTLSSEQSKRKLKKRIQQLLLEITDEDYKIPDCSANPVLGIIKTDDRDEKSSDETLSDSLML